MREETLKRRARLMREMLRLVDKLQLGDGWIAKRMNVSHLAVARYRDGHPAKNIQHLGEIVVELRKMANEPIPPLRPETVIELPAPEPQPIEVLDTKLPPLPMPVAVNFGIAPKEAWRQGYKDGFKDGIDFADRLSLGLVREEMQKRG